VLLHGQPKRMPHHVKPPNAFEGRLHAFVAGASSRSHNCNSQYLLVIEDAIFFAAFVLAFCTESKFFE